MKNPSPEHNQEDMTDGDSPNSHSVQSYDLFHTKSGRQSTPFLVIVDIDGQTLEMEEDTGAAISLMSETAFRNLWGNSEQPSLRWSPIRLTTYTGESTQARGSYYVTVTYGNNTHQLQLLVVPRDGPTLLGRNWLDVVKLTTTLGTHPLTAGFPATNRTTAPPCETPRSSSKMNSGH